MSDVQAEVTTPVQPPVPEVQEDPSKDISDALSQHAGAPSKEQIENWKMQYGEVLCSGFSETELYIWRPIGRAEFVKLQTQLVQLKEPISLLETESMIVDGCIPWASEIGKKSLLLKAGSLSSLHEQIMANSNFMDPRVAQAMVIKL